MDYSTILYDVDDGILTITLNRPEALNAFTNDMLVELIDACDRADADDNVSAIIVTGAEVLMGAAIVLPVTTNASVDCITMQSARKRKRNM